ncbi:hypothetical protein [Vibrio mediterranei]|uniref:hypothetical protein n=1 Tax=Vibrio mediterranei TaxID=689 RepID=UPI004068A87F
MITFITDIRKDDEPDILTAVKHEALLIVSIEGQLLNRFEAPMLGWSHESLCALSDTFPKQWSVCGADALLGEQWVGSSEV